MTNIDRKCLDDGIQLLFWKKKVIKRRKNISPITILFELENRGRLIFEC